MASSFLAEIQLSYNQFTRTEKKIADYVLKNSDKVLFMSISDLSDACRVADASVHRFCRTVGVKGYQEFKMKLSLSLAPEDDKGVLGAEERHFGLERLANECIDDCIEVLRETRRLVDYDAIETLVTMMTNARQVYFFGIGDSLLTAQMARNRFLRITNKVNCIQDPHMQAMTASMATEEDLIVFISYSGSTKDNIYVAQIAKEAGAKIAAVTKFRKSPLTAYTDVVLLCGSNEGPLQGGSVGAKMSQMFILDLLYQEYYRRNHEASKTNKHKTAKAVVEKLY